MLFELHDKSPVPIYEQIVSQVIFAVASDGLAAGEIIPSVRDMAQRILAHPNTVARAYQELERRGVLTANAVSAWKSRRKPQSCAAINGKKSSAPTSVMLCDRRWRVHCPPPKFANWSMKS